MHNYKLAIISHWIRFATLVELFSQLMESFSFTPKIFRKYILLKCADLNGATFLLCLYNVRMCSAYLYSRVKTTFLYENSISQMDIDQYNFILNQDFWWIWIIFDQNSYYSLACWIYYFLSLIHLSVPKWKKLTDWM